MTARSLGFTGAGVKVAFLADGIDPANVNLQRGGKSVISRYADFTGQGTAAATEGGEAFIDANAIAGQGRQVYNVAGFGAQSPGTACNIRIEGVAPGASLVALKVFSDNDISTTSGFLQAIDYAVDTEHVNVLNESFGSNPFPDVSSLDAVEKFNNMAVAAGVTVVVAAGDAGPFNTIGSPAADPNVISVGASTDFRFYAQTDYAGADKFAPGGLAERQHQRALQRRLHPGRADPGPGGARRPVLRLLHGRCGEVRRLRQLPRPGLAGRGVRRDERVRARGRGGGGAGHPGLPEGARRVHPDARRREADPAVDRHRPRRARHRAGIGAAEQPQGGRAGLLTCRTASSIGETLRLSSNQLNYVGKPGATAHWSVTVTNASAKTQKVAVAGRGFTANSVVKQATVTLSDSRSAHFTSWTGTAANYAAVRFTVPAGQALLNGSIAWPSTAASASHPNKRVRLVLVDPSGRLAAHSLPQGADGYGTAQVLRPAAGAWTAEIFSDESTAGGTAAAVRFGASVARASSFGSMSPSSVTLAPGASAAVRVSAVVPAGAGDSSGTIEFAAGPARRAGERARHPARPGRRRAGHQRHVQRRADRRQRTRPGRGSGRVAYSFAVPSGLPVMLRDLEVNVVLGNDPENQVSAYLISPGGQTMGYGSNYLTTGFTATGVPVESPRRQLSLYTSDETAGVWRLIIDFTSPVPGNELTDPFTGLIRFNAVRWSRGKLPASVRTTLKAGKSYSYQITLDNTGAAPEDVFLDARRRSLATYTLAPQDAVTGPEAAAGRLGRPAGVDRADDDAQRVGHRHVEPAGDVRLRAVPRRPGRGEHVGRRGDGRVPARPVDDPGHPGSLVRGAVRGRPLRRGQGGRGDGEHDHARDHRGVRPDGDLARGRLLEVRRRVACPSASYNLFQVNPGQTRTLTLTIKPSGKAGTEVRGVLYVDDFVDSLQFLSGSQLVAIPYEYKVG